MVKLIIIGLMVKKTVKELINSIITINMKDILLMEKEMEKEGLNYKIIDIYGILKSFMLENGKMIKCQVKDNFLQLMAKLYKLIFLMIK